MLLEGENLFLGGTGFQGHSLYYWWPGGLHTGNKFQVSLDVKKKHLSVEKVVDKQPKSKKRR